MSRARRILLCLIPLLAIPLLVAGPARAQVADEGTKADAERSIQAYLAMWSRDAGVTRDAVDRFYAPQVVYYGRPFSRAEILADKLAYIRRWPQRSYREVPGSLTARCNADRSLCKVAVDMEWRRASWGHPGVRAASGRAHMVFDFVPAEGGRKIARESARIL